MVIRMTKRKKSKKKSKKNPFSKKGALSGMDYIAKQSWKEFDG